MRKLTNTEDGFSLVEASVALVISVLLFVMLGSALAAAMNSSRNSRVKQEATAIGVQYIELSRSLTWDELAMDAVETGDDRVSANQLLASAADLPANEDLAVDAALGLIDSKFTEVVDDSTFTVFQYVTLINPEIKRVVVFVEWDNDSTAWTHHVSTVIAENRKWSTP